MRAYERLKDRVHGQSVLLQGGKVGVAVVLDAGGEKEEGDAKEGFE